MVFGCLGLGRALVSSYRDEAGGSGVARVHADCPDGCAHDLLLDQGGRLASDNSVARGVVLFDELKEAVMAAQAHALGLVVEL
jgi:hypothetical protein